MAGYGSCNEGRSPQSVSGVWEAAQETWALHSRMVEAAHDYVIIPAQLSELSSCRTLPCCAKSPTSKSITPIGLYWGRGGAGESWH